MQFPVPVPLPLRPSLSALRPDDLLALRFTWSNLTLADGKLTRSPGRRDAFLIVDLGPQHILEEAYFESVGKADLPPRRDGSPDPDNGQPDNPLPQPGTRIPARMSGRSRLAFHVPPSVTEIVCTLEALLQAMAELPLSVDPRALPPPAERGLLQRPSPAVPPVAEPAPERTAIEAPWHLVLSPNALGAWLHPQSAVKASGSGRYPLWHTRLGVRPGTPAAQQSGVIHDGRYTHQRQADGTWRVSEIRADPVDHNRTIRAIWSPDYDEEQIPEPDGRPKFVPFRAALDRRDRHELVALTSTPTTKDWLARAVDARLLILSSLGAWLDLDYRHDRDPDHDELTIESWRHRAALGRDTYVRVVYAGFLCPFRHRASLVKVTERKLESRAGAPPQALLRQRMFVVVRQHEVTIPPGQRRMPFRRVRITTQVTPNLDAPETGPGAVAGNRSAFCPHIGKKPFLFQLVAEDWEGRRCDFTAPLIFLDTNVDAGTATNGPLDDVIDAYATRETDGDVWRIRPVHRQKVAFAESGSESGSTTLETEMIEFGAKKITSGVAAADPHFRPVVESAQVFVPAIEQLVGPAVAAKITIDDTYVSGWGATPPAGQVFARLPEGLPAKFKSDRSGGVATPNVNVGGLSRRFGLVGGSQGNVATFNSGTFDPKEFFKGLEAKILGGIDLFQIVNPVSFAEGTIPVVKTTPQGPNPQAPTALQTEMSWEPPVKDFGPYRPHDPPPGKPRFRLETTVRTDFLDPKQSTSRINGELNAFDLNLFGFVVLPFKALRFDANAGEKMHVSAEIGDVTFGGPLEFVNELRSYLGGDGFTDPPGIDVTPEGIRSSFSLELPSVAVGVMTLQNISFGAGFNIPFSGQPVRVRFAFCERARPFHLLIYCFGGGGFFGIDLGADGVEMLEASLEFGAAIEIDVGVASGGVHLMAGIYYSWKEAEQQAWLEGYLRMGGELDILGLVSLSLEFIMSLAHDSKNNVVWGEATLIVEVEVAFFSDSVEVSVRRELGDPDRIFVEDMLTEADWEAYWGAFAAA
jgi:hypothetical protein